MLRSLSKFPQLETWVTKAKNLIDSFNKELGIEKLDETLNTISANTSLAQTNTKIEFGSLNFRHLITEDTDIIAILRFHFRPKKA